MKRFVLFGTSGLLGQAWLTWLESQEDVEVVSVGRTPPPGTRPPNAVHLTLDLTRPNTAVERIAALRPYAIVHLAGHNATEFDKDTEAGTTAVAAMSTTLAEAALLCRAKAVLLSCDRVFDGVGGTPTEDVTPQPGTPLGKALRAAEEIVEQTCDDRLILRTSWLYGHVSSRSDTLLSRWLVRWNQGQAATAPVDVVGCPTWVRALPRIGHALLRRDGIYHVGGPERCSLYDLAVRLAGALDMPSSRVRGMAAHEDATVYGPPVLGGLNSDRYQTVTGGMPSIDSVVSDLARVIRRTVPLA
jgi:dTDP-4-dehydrorhamnose reductase